VGLFERLKADAGEDWQAYVEHPFVRGLADGSLPRECFRHYLVQDYLFLIHFARAYALAAYKAPDLDGLRHNAATVSAILDEMKLHVRLAAEWGAGEADLAGAVEAQATVAYTRFVLDAGMRGDLLDLMTALAPCVVGYGEIGKALAERPGALAAASPYRGWIEEYAGDAYQEIAGNARAELDRLAAVSLTEARYPQLLGLFRQATRLEGDFWQMGLEANSK
jgi:thiaminase (transcriptional activator TenA)